MISFSKPENLDGGQLLEELAVIGIHLDKFEQAPLLDGDNKLWLQVEEDVRTKVENILQNHQPKPRPEPTVADKLASVGLDLNDLKAALGL